MRAMQPILDERLPWPLHFRAFALRDFVLVMREDQVLAAQVQIEAGAEQFHAHRAALDVPARPAVPPRTRPENRPIFWRPRLP